MDADTMMEAGWPAHLIDHAREIEIARGLASVEVGWYYSPRHGSIGGPAPQAAINDAVDVITMCAALGIPAPSPFPMPTDVCGIELDWCCEGHSQEMCSLEWVGPGVWQLYLDIVDGTPQFPTRTALVHVRRQIAPVKPCRLTDAEVNAPFKRWAGLLDTLDEEAP